MAKALIAIVIATAILTALATYSLCVISGQESRREEEEAARQFNELEE